MQNLDQQLIKIAVSSTPATPPSPTLLPLLVPVLSQERALPPTLRKSRVYITLPRAVANLQQVHLWTTHPIQVHWRCWCSYHPSCLSLPYVYCRSCPGRSDWRHGYGCAPRCRRCLLHVNWEDCVRKLSKKPLSHKACRVLARVS
jgi:hypothetical protein